MHLQLFEEPSRLHDDTQIFSKLMCYESVSVGDQS